MTFEFRPFFNGITSMAFVYFLPAAGAGIINRL